MPWITTKEGKHINTDWFDDEKKKEQQIAQNKEQSKSLNYEEQQRDEDKKDAELSTYKDAMNYKDFVRQNLAELKQIYKVEGDEGVRERWYKVREAQEKKSLKEVPIEDAIKTIREAVPDNVHSGWFRSANSEYKPKLVDGILGTEGALNAGYNIGYYNYRHQFERYSEVWGKWVPHDGVDQSKKMSFEQWLNTPQTMYRGTYGQSAVRSDLFQSYTPDKKIAEKFFNESAGGKIEEIMIKPIDTWGSYQTTAEQEFLIPISELKKRGK